MPVRFPAVSRPSLRPEWLIAFVALYVVALLNGPWWAAVTAGRSASEPGTWLFVAGLGVALTCLHFIVFAIPATRRTTKALLYVVVIAAAAAGYYMRTYAVILDPTMMRNVVRTDWRESRELITFGSVSRVLLAALPAVAVIYWVQLTDRAWPRAVAWRLGSMFAALLLLALGVLLVSRDFVPLMREQREMRYLITPGNMIYSVIRNARVDVQTSAGPRKVVGADATRRARAVAAARPSVFVFVLGETARAANFSLLGYARETTPELAKVPGLLAFSDVTACGTSTEVSVPCMFSPYGRADYDERAIRGSEGVLNVLARAGVDVLWLDNQSGCKGTCEGPGIRYRKPDASFASDLCRGEDCFDEILLRALDQELPRIERDTVIVLHTLGNHGPAYFNRYPEAFRRFTPDCRTTELRRCTQQELVNAYDNGILYTDHIVAETIRRLDAASERLDSALWYMSDHGESLGESGLYLHGIPYAIAPRLQTHVPMVYWSTSGFAQARGLSSECLAARRAEPLSHDNLFDSLLGIMDVQTQAYRPARDLFAACRRQP